MNRLEYDAIVVPERLEAIQSLYESTDIEKAGDVLAEAIIMADLEKYVGSKLMLEYDPDHIVYDISLKKAYKGSIVLGKLVDFKVIGPANGYGDVCLEMDNLNIIETVGANAFTQVKVISGFTPFSGIRLWRSQLRESDA